MSGMKLLPARGVPIYESLSNFPSGSDGDLAVAKDNDTLYLSDGANWNTIASSPSITRVGDSNTLDLGVALGEVTGNVRYQDTNSVNLSDNASGLKADVKIADTDSVNLSIGAGGISADVNISATGTPASGKFAATTLIKGDGLFIEVADSDITSRVLSGYVAASGSVSNFDTIETATEKLGWNVDNTNDIYQDTKEPSGFINPDLISVSYSYTDRKVTVTSSSGSIETRYRGVKSTVASPWVSAAHDAASGTWFLYATGALSGAVWEQSQWTFDQIQISTGFYHSLAATGTWFLRECHGLMQWQSHEEDHETIGTYWRSGLGLTAGTYVVYANNTAPTDVADNAFGVDTGVIKDEDVATTVPVLPEGTYTTAYRSGVNGDWIFNTVATLPYFVNTNTLAYNAISAGTWQLLSAAEDDFINVFDYAFPVAGDDDSQKYRHVMITGQAKYTSLTAALLEFPQNIELGNLTSLSPEFVCVNRITYQFNAVGTGAVGAGVTGRCKIMAVTPIRGTRASQVAVSGAAPADHGNLSGLGDDDHLQYELISGRAANVVTQSVDFTMNSGVILYQVDTSGGNKTVTLLDPSTVSGKIVTFLNMSTNNITFAGYAIGGVSNFTIDGNERLQIVSDGSAWRQYARKNMSFWKTGITYCKDVLIEVIESGYEGLWRCTTQHTAGANFAGDVANWDLIPCTYTQNDATNASASPDVSNYSSFASSASGTSAVFTFESRGAIEFLIDVNTDGGMVIACDYKSSTVNALSDPSGLFLSADTGTGIYVGKATGTAAVTVKNRTGATKTIGVLAVRSKLTATTWS